MPRHTYASTDLNWIEGPVLPVLQDLPEGSCHGAWCDARTKPGWLDPALWAAVVRSLRPGSWVLAPAPAASVDRVMLPMRVGGLEIMDVVAVLKPGGTWSPVILARHPGAFRPLHLGSLPEEDETREPTWWPGVGSWVLRHRVRHTRYRQPALARFSPEPAGSSGPCGLGGPRPFFPCCGWLKVPGVERSPTEALGRLIRPPDGPLLHPAGGRLLAPRVQLGDDLAEILKAGWGQILGLLQDQRLMDSPSPEVLEQRARQGIVRALRVLRGGSE